VNATNPIRQQTQALCLLITMLLTSSAIAAEGIHVSGRGMVETVPDMGIVNLHIRREGEDPAALEQAMNQVVADVLKLTRKMKVAERDVTAALVSIQPRYQRRDDETVLAGVTATRTVTVVLRKLTDFPALLTAALALGVNNVDPMQLDTSQRAALESKALDLAMADARARAEQVAAGFAVSCGKVLDVQVSSYSVAPKMAMMEMRMSADSDAFAPGQIRIEQTVDATFAIKDQI